MVDIEQLISEMTQDEKISLLAGADLWHTVAIPRLGISAIRVTDGPNGARGAQGNMGPTSACFPVGMALGATWNTALVEKVGEALADEVKAKGSHILLAPTVNIHRTPIAGRNFECFSEDPYHSGKMATAYINGIQNNGAGACIKHYVCNDQEFERNSISSEVEERPLREIYLEPFRLAIRDAKPWSVMSSYNKVRGTFASENDYTLLTILKNEWGFEGFVMSDWFGTYTPAVPGGGLDLEMPGPGRWMSAEHVRAALDKGELSLDGLDDKVRRILHIVELAGAFENPELPAERADDKPQHRAIIREAAREAIVLLVNRENALPLDIQKTPTIAVIGELARWPNIMGGGSSQVTPHYIISPLEGIRSHIGNRAKVEYEIGCRVHKSLPVPELENLASEDGQPGLTIRIFDNLDFSGKPAYEAVTDRFNFGWFDASVPNVTQERFCVRMTGTFTTTEAGLHTFGITSVGQSKLLLDGEIAIDNWNSNSPNIEKTVQKELLVGQKVAVQIDFRWEGNRIWRSLRFSHLAPISSDLIADAVELAKHADVAIVIAGLTAEWEAEGFDRINMDLPGAQNELIEKVAAANPNTIVVLNAASALSMPWIDKVAAVVEQWYNSQECGNALADVLFGDTNPSGKLPTTFPVRLEDNPAYINYPGENGKVNYGEGLFVGYRYYDKKKVEPLFPYGYGLSYTTFTYGNLKLNAAQFTAESGLEVSFDVTNIGPRTGKEIVQLYVRDVRSALVRPEKELKAFAKLELTPGETKTISFHLDQEAFWYYNPAASSGRGGWVAEPGEFDILVGASSRDIRLSATVSLLPTRAEGNRLHTGMTLREIFNDDAGKAVFAKHFAEWMATPDLQMALDQTIDQIAAFAPHVLTPEKLAALATDLEQA